MARQVWQPPVGHIADAVTALDRILDRDWSRRDRKRLIAAMVVVEDAWHAEMDAEHNSSVRTTGDAVTTQGNADADG